MSRSSSVCVFIDSSALVTETLGKSHDLTAEKMASQSTGIQQLLKAEKQAAEKVSEARKRKFIYCDEFFRKLTNLKC